MKILLIEDSKIQRIVNGRALIKAGYSVIKCWRWGRGAAECRPKSSRSYFVGHDAAEIVGTRCFADSQERCTCATHRGYRAERTGPSERNQTADRRRSGISCKV